MYNFGNQLTKAVISMYKSFINIKHLNRSHLYWGIDKATGDVVDIDEVKVFEPSLNDIFVEYAGDAAAEG